MRCPFLGQHIGAPQVTDPPQIHHGTMIFPLIVESTVENFNGHTGKGQILLHNADFRILFHLIQCLQMFRTAAKIRQVIHVVQIPCIHCHLLEEIVQAAIRQAHHANLLGWLGKEQPLLPRIIFPAPENR